MELANTMKKSLLQGTGTGWAEFEFSVKTNTGFVFLKRLLRYN